MIRLPKQAEPVMRVYVMEGRTLSRLNPAGEYCQTHYEPCGWSRYDKFEGDCCQQYYCSRNGGICLNYAEDRYYRTIGGHGSEQEAIEAVKNQQKEQQQQKEKELNDCLNNCDQTYRATPEWDPYRSREQCKANCRGESTVRYRPTPTTYQPTTTWPTSTYQPNTYQPTTTWATNQPATTWGINQPATTWGTNQPATTWGTYQPTTTWGTNQPTTAWGTYQPTTTWGTNQPTTTWGTYQPTQRWW